MMEEEKDPILSNDSEAKEPIQESLPLSTPVAEAIIEFAPADVAETPAPVAEIIVEPTIEETVVESIPAEITDAPVIEVITEPVVDEILAEEIMPEKIEEPVVEPISTPADIQRSEENSSFKNAIGIIGVLLAILALVYFVTKNPANTVTPLSNQIVSVSTTQEQGKVNIIEEVKNDVNIPGGGSEDIVYQKIKATAYLGNTQKNPNSIDCALTYPLEREIDKKYESPMINSVLALLEPLTLAEKEQGFVSAIPAGTILKYLKLDDSGVMSVNLSGNISKAAGSCAVTAIRSAITNTLSQFSSVKSVIICIDGNCNDEEILQP